MKRAIIALFICTGLFVPTIASAKKKEGSPSPLFLSSFLVGKPLDQDKTLHSMEQTPYGNRSQTAAPWRYEWRHDGSNRTSWGLLFNSLQTRGSKGRLFADEMALRVGFLPVRLDFWGFFLNAQVSANLSLAYVRIVSTESRSLAQVVDDFDADPKKRTTKQDSASRMEYFPMAGASGTMGVGYCLYKFCATGHIGYEHISLPIGSGHKSDLDFSRVGSFGQLGLGLLYVL
jgi:hypothetical protein